MSPRRGGLLAGLALVALASSLALAAGAAGARPAEAWTRLELVENSAEGPAYDRCAVETTVKKGSGARWRLFYGEARADSASGWSAIRSSSGCRLSAAQQTAASQGTMTATPVNDATSWGLSGSPYLVVDVAIAKASVAGAEVLLDATISTRKLTGFGQEGAPAYDSATETRTIRVTGDTSAVIPVLIASQKETDEFRVRELLLKFHARVPGSAPAVQYGEIAITADVPRARILLDGGAVGRTSAEGPVVLTAVRTGDREVIVQDASGREARIVTRVAKGKRSTVALTVLKPSGPAADGLRPLGPNPQGAEEFWREKDGAVVVRIPAGEFQMGSPDGEGDASERPKHAVRVHGILMDKAEVTWGQYKLFQAASGKSIAKPPIWGTPETVAVSGISWDDARAYCEWVGGRLPTEAEWEHEARGDAGWTYPWGNTFEPWRCNTRDGGPHAPGVAGDWPDCASEHGVLDLAGSVAEWCSDFYKSGYEAGDAPVENPVGPAAGTTRSVRGGNWMSASYNVRNASRIGVEPAWNGPMQGFRCVQDDRGTPAP